MKSQIITKSTFINRIIFYNELDSFCKEFQNLTGGDHDFLESPVLSLFAQWCDLCKF